MYLSLIHSRVNTPDVVKLYYLKSYLKCEALELIKNIPIAENQYVTAWETLTSFFDNERRLVYNYLSDPYEVKPMASDTYAEVKRLLSQVFTPLDALQAMNRSTKNWSDMIVFLLINKMDKSTR